MRRRSPLISLATPIYRALLGLYPAEFRHTYGPLMVQVFRDASRDRYHAHGLGGLAAWWCATVIDLVRTVIEQRRKNIVSRPQFTRSTVAALISLILCLPFMLIAITATLNYEPPYVQPLEELMFSDDGYTPTPLGRLVMLGLLFSLPIAFVINLLPMLTMRGSEWATLFKPTRAHFVIGMALLLAVSVTLSGVVGYELRPFVKPLGIGSTLGLIVFLLGLLIVPVAFLLNLLPLLAEVGSGGTLRFRPTSLNLIIGAVILLMILMVGSAFMLEEIACSSGVPNCD